MAHIMHVSTVHSCTDTRILKHCDALLGAEHRVTLLACGSAPQRPQADLSVLSSGEQTSDRIVRIFRQVGVLRRILRADPDLVFFHDPELLPLMCLLGGPGFRKKIVFDMHEDFRSSLEERNMPVAARMYSLWLKLAERRMLISLAEDSYRPLFRHPYPVFHNYPAAMPEGLKASHGKRFVYIGDVSQTRGAYAMMRGLAEADLPEWHLDIIGPCWEHGTARDIAALSVGLGLEERFHWHGYMQLREALAMLCAGSVGLALLHPKGNYVHCPPGKVFEYLSLGMPAVVSDFPTYRKCFDGTATVFVDPLDRGAIAHALRTAATSTALRDQAWAQRHHVRQRFCWATEAVRLARFVELALGRPAALSHLDCQALTCV